MAKATASDKELFKKEILREMASRKAKPISDLFHKFYDAFERALIKKAEKKEIKWADIPAHNELLDIVEDFDNFLEAEEGEKALFSKELNLVQYLCYKAEALHKYFKTKNTERFLEKIKDLRHNTILKLHSFRKVKEISQEISMRLNVFKRYDRIIRAARKEKDPDERQEIISELEFVFVMIERIRKAWPDIKKFIRHIKSMKQTMIDEETKNLIDYIREFSPLTAKELKAYLRRLDEILVKQRKHIPTLVKNVNVIRSAGEKVAKLKEEFAGTSTS